MLSGVCTEVKSNKMAPPNGLSTPPYKLSICWQTILMKYHTLFFRKLRNLLSATVMIGALRVNANLMSKGSSSNMVSTPLDHIDSWITDH